MPELLLHDDDENLLMSAIRIERVDASDDELLAVVTRMCMETVLETIPEFLGQEAIARRHLPNFEFDAMRAMIAESAARPEHRILVATSDGVVVGYSIVSVKRNEAGELYGYLFSRGVAGSYRRQGIATMLLRAAEAWFLEHGIVYAQAETHLTNVPLQTLLMNHGFAVVEQGAGAWPSLVLRKSYPALCGCAVR